MSTQIKIRLKKEHKHAGVKHSEGKEITVPGADAEWLVANGIGEIIPAEQAAEAENQGPPKGKSKP